MKIARIREECYQVNIYLLWPAKVQQLERYVQENLDENYRDTDDFVGRCVENISSENGQTIVIALEQFKRNNIQNLTTLAHECFHAAEYILHHRGIFHSAATSEAYAYLSDSIFRRCLEKLLK